MKRSISRTMQIVVLLLLAATLPAMTAFASQRGSISSRDRDQLRTVTGTVVDRSEDPLPGSVVYLKNTKTLAVKSFISDDSGGFRFTALLPNVDYEIYAEFNAQRSSTKTLSSFDSRTNVQMQLKIDVKK